MPLLYSSKRSSWDVAEDAEDTEKPEAAPEPVLAKRDKRVLGVIAITALVTFFGGLALAGYAAINYKYETCLLYTSPSPRDATLSRMPSSA